MVKQRSLPLIAHILRHSGSGGNALLGGSAVSYNGNYWSDERNAVVEADEYDRSFLRLRPDIAVITAMDADHLDIYGTAEAVEQAFIDFSGCLKPGGLLFSKKGLRREAELKGTRHFTYGLASRLLRIRDPDRPGRLSLPRTERRLEHRQGRTAHGRPP